MKIRAFLVAVSLALAGCGYHPLYGNRADEVKSGDLSQIYVAAISDRPGQQLRNYLLDQVNANGQPARPIYTLQTSLTIASTGVSLSRDNTNSRTNITAIAKYSLQETASGKILFAATSRGTDSYDVLLSDFATLTSREDAVNRALREVADDMGTKISVYFQNQKVGSSPAPVKSLP
jgi:LPS-assembly lipoprotein